MCDFFFLDGMAAADPSSDWNAPVEHWGNYEDPPVLVTPAPVQKEQPVPNKVFFLFCFLLILASYCIVSIIGFT